MKASIAYLRQKRWSPYAGGVLLGLTSVAAIGFSEQLLGSSGSFENLAGAIEKAISPSLADNYYYQYIMPPGMSWQVWLSIVSSPGPSVVPRATSAGACCPTGSGKRCSAAALEALGDCVLWGHRARIRRRDRRRVYERSRDLGRRHARAGGLHLCRRGVRGRDRPLAMLLYRGKEV